jgi:hypothetical protein
MRLLLLAGMQLGALHAAVPARASRAPLARIALRMSGSPLSERVGARGVSWRGGSTAVQAAAASPSQGGSQGGEGAGYTLISTELLAQLLQLTQCPCSTESLPPLRRARLCLPLSA